MTAPPDLMVAAVKMVLSLALVLIVLWALHRLARRKLSLGQNAARTGLIRVLESRYLGVKKSIALVQVPGSVLVLGLGADQISLLGRIDQPEFIAQMQSKIADKPSAGFWSHFSRAVSRPIGPDRSATQPGFGCPESE